MDRNKAKGYILMFISSSCMGGIGAFARFIEAPGLFISFSRNFAGLLLLTGIFLFTKQFVNLKKLKITPSIVFSGIFLGLLSGLYVVSTQMTTLANAAFLIYTGPVYSTILAAIFLKEPFTKATLASLSAVFVGAMLIIGIIEWDSGLQIGLQIGAVEGYPNKALGDLIALASGVAYGLYLFVSRYRGDVDSNTRAYTNFFFAVITLGILLIFMPPDLSEMTTRGWIILVIAAVVTGAVAFYLLAFATRLLMAGELATIAYQETIMAALLGVLLFSESMTLLQVLGGVLIIGGGVGQILYSTRNPGMDSEAVSENTSVAAEGQPTR